MKTLIFSTLMIFTSACFGHQHPHWRVTVDPGEYYYESSDFNPWPGFHYKMRGSYYYYPGYYYFEPKYYYPRHQHQHKTYRKYHKKDNDDNN